MEKINKVKLGTRIRRIRLGAKLKQWQLAERLGTTQSAIHKYERGVVPEPRRLMEIARVGQTSVEWILTGQHLDGSTNQEHVSPSVIELARRLEALEQEEQKAIDEALEILERAVDAASAHRSHELNPDTCKTADLLHVAKGIHRSIVGGISDRSSRRLDLLDEN